MGLHRVCILAGTTSGRPEYEAVARAFGEELVRRELGLLCGASTGLTSPVADALLRSSRDVIGVVPNEVTSDELERYDMVELHEVGSLRERTALMADLADVFVALPGGLETFGELFEVLAWAQEGLHSKPIGVLDAMGYFKPFLALLERAARDGLLAASPAALLQLDTDPARLLGRLTRGLRASTPAERIHERHVRGAGLVAVLYNVAGEPAAIEHERRLERAPAVALAGPR
jgi:uncharacterized protein (TIGR00730 family)